jgi:hypothetical protein
LARFRAKNAVQKVAIFHDLGTKFTDAFASAGLLDNLG